MTGRSMTRSALCMSPASLMLSATQTALALGVSRTRVHQLIAAGTLKATRVGHAWIISPRDLARLMASRERQPNTNPKPE